MHPKDYNVQVDFSSDLDESTSIEWHKKNWVLKPSTKEEFDNAFIRAALKLNELSNR